MTKCGRYGPSSFDYSPAMIRKTVKQSLTRLKTDYLDTVYLHDVEYVCTPITPRETGNHVLSLDEDAAAYGLAEGDEASVRGNGDKTFLDAFYELQALQREGLVKNIGFTGTTRLQLATASLTISQATLFPLFYDWQFSSGIPLLTNPWT